MQPQALPDNEFLRLQTQERMPLMQRAVRNNSAYADSPGARLYLVSQDHDDVMKVAPHCLQQLMPNPLSNAAGFSPERGGTGCESTDGEGACFAIERAIQLGL